MGTEGDKSADETDKYFLYKNILEELSRRFDDVPYNSEANDVLVTIYGYKSF